MNNNYNIKINISVLFKLYKHKTDEVDAVLNNIKRYTQEGINLVSKAMNKENTISIDAIKSRYLKNLTRGLLQLNSASKTLFDEELIEGYIPLKDTNACRYLLSLFINEVQKEI